jgi:hypothetical protein
MLLTKLLQILLICGSTCARGGAKAVPIRHAMHPVFMLTNLLGKVEAAAEVHSWKGQFKALFRTLHGW